MSREGWIKEYCELESKVSETFNAISKKLPCKSLENIDIVLIAMVKRIVNNYNAINILFRNEMYLESLMIIRSVMEATFVFNGLIEKPIETYDKLLKLSNNNKKELHKKALTYEDLKANAEKYNFDDLDSKYISIKMLSELSVQNRDLYNIAYKMISDLVHLNLFSIEKFLLLNGKNKFSIKENLDKKEVREAYLTLAYCIYMIEASLNKKYMMGLDKELKELEKSLENIK